MGNHLVEPEPGRTLVGDTRLTRFWHKIPLQGLTFKKAV
jgi:hypothetical protein